MKLTAEMISRAELWVEQNGLYPQRCGAPIKDFCKAMGITERSYNNWSKISGFSEALTRAREKFTARTITDVSNALIKAAKGVDFTRVKEEARADKVVEYDAKTSKKVKEYMGELKTVKASRETFYYPPDTKAAIFVLTNMQPDNWKDKQQKEVTMPEPIIKVVHSEEEKQELESMKDLDI